MNKIYLRFMHLPNRMRDSIRISVAIVGFVSMLFTVLGVSLASVKSLGILYRLVIIIVALVVICFICYYIIGRIFRESVTLKIRQTPVSITTGDIFNEKGWIVIGCDNHFDTRVDDVIIAKKSLHGKLVLEHGEIKGIENAVEKEARRLKLSKNEKGQYEFPLGSIVKYESEKDKKTYLMLAFTRLDEEYRAYTNMAEYEQTLMKMWKELDRIYAMHDIALPILGAGIPRFDSGPIGRDELLKCMLCTLNGSGVSFNANINFVIYGEAKDISLYEYKDMFHELISR